MSDFEWAWPKRIDRAAIEAVLRLDFLAAGRNVVLVAAQGLGKTMIAQNIAHAAVLGGTHVLFTTAAQLLLDLGSQESTRALPRRLNHYATRGLLVIDLW
jgi:DNA replication protein DnaC